MHTHARTHSYAMLCVCVYECEPGNGKEYCSIMLIDFSSRIKSYYRRRSKAMLWQFPFTHNQQAGERASKRERERRNFFILIRNCNCNSLSPSSLSLARSLTLCVSLLLLSFLHTESVVGNSYTTVLLPCALCLHHRSMEQAKMLLCSIFSILH